MNYSTRIAIHRIWLLLLFGVVVFFFLKTGTVNSSVSIQFILNNGRTGEPLSIGMSILIWVFLIFIFGMLISAIVCLFEIVFFATLFSPEVESKRRFRYSLLPVYSKRAEKEWDIGFRLSFVIGFGCSLLLIIFEILGLYQR